MSAIALLVQVDTGTRSQRTWTLWSTFALTAIGFGLLLAATRAASGFGYGASIAGLINAYLLIVPLLGLVMGALTIARDRERGTFAYLRAQPISVSALYWSKCLTLVLLMSISVWCAFALIAALALLVHIGIEPWGFIQFAALTWLLAIVSANLGLMLSAAMHRTPAALGIAIAVWLGLVVFADIGLMVTALATQLGTQGLLTATLVNPIETYKIASVAALSGSIDVLGPGGRLATDIFGAMLMPVMSAFLAAWGVVAALVGRVLLERSIRA